MFCPLSSATARPTGLVVAEPPRTEQSESRPGHRRVLGHVTPRNQPVLRSDFYRRRNHDGLPPCGTQWSCQLAAALGPTSTVVAAGTLWRVDSPSARATAPVQGRQMGGAARRVGCEWPCREGTAVVPRAVTVPGAAAVSVAGGRVEPRLPCWGSGLPDSVIPDCSPFGRWPWRRRPLRALLGTGKCGVVVDLPLLMPPHIPPVYPLNVPNVFARTPLFTHFAQQ